MNSLPKVAVVILNWNGKRHLEQFLPSVLASEYKALSVIVADNASTDDSVPFLRSHFPGVRIIENERNEGFSQGYNSALKQVDADYLVLLNSDVEVTPGWIEPVIDLMETDASIAACQPKILSFTEPAKFEYAGACGGFIDKFGYPFSRGRVFDHCETDFGQFDQSIPVFWATGAALFIRATVFRELGGFDPYFFAHQEEIDLCWRIHRAGYSVYAQPASVIYHVGGGTLPMGSRKKVFLNFRNNLVMLSRNLPFAECLYKIPARICLDMVAGFQALLQGNFSTFISIETAHLHYLGWLFARKAKNSLPKIKMSKLPGVYHGSIVWDFFIRKKKTFLEIVGNNK